MNRPMQNGEALHHAMAVITEHLATRDISRDDRELLAETLELLHQMKKEAEIRRDDNLSSEAEEELCDIFAGLQENHFSQNKIWVLAVPPWKTVRNALYLRTGVCLSKGMILKRYYDYCRDEDNRFTENEDTAGLTGKDIVDGLAGLCKEIREVRG